MTETLTELAKPIKGTIWQHPTRRDYDGKPMQYTVTSVRKHPRLGLVVYSVDRHGSSYNVPRVKLAAWHDRATIVSVPDSVPTTTGPRLTRAECEALHREAHIAGHAAAVSVTPRPMIVERHAKAFDDRSPVVQTYQVSEGACGFAWVSVHPGNGSYARYLKSTGLARPSSEGGVQIWISAYNQSLERKSAYASAYAQVIQNAGITAYGHSRMD